MLEFCVEFVGFPQSSRGTYVDLLLHIHNLLVVIRHFQAQVPENPWTDFGFEFEL